MLFQRQIRGLPCLVGHVVLPAKLFQHFHESPSLARFTGQDKLHGTHRGCRAHYECWMSMFLNPDVPKTVMASTDGLSTCKLPPLLWSCRQYCNSVLKPAEQRNVTSLMSTVMCLTPEEIIPNKAISS